MSRDELQRSPVTISSTGTQLAMDVQPNVDRASTEALADAINAALAVGVEVRLDLGSSVPHDRDGVPTVMRLGPSASSSSPVADAVGTGTLRVSREAACWTIDVQRSRVCRTDAAIECRFLPAMHWAPVSAITISGQGPTSVSN